MADLSPGQLLAIEVYAALGDKPTEDEIAEQVGVSRMTLWEWRKKPEFVAAIREAGRANIAATFGSVLNALVKQAKKGNVAAARLLLETGALTSQQRDLNINVGDGYRAIVEESMKLAQEVSEEEFAGVQ